jgi:hypothetical protein
MARPNLEVALVMAFLLPLALIALIKMCGVEGLP